MKILSPTNTGPEIKQISPHNDPGNPLCDILKISWGLIHHFFGNVAKRHSSVPSSGTVKRWRNVLQSHVRHFLKMSWQFIHPSARNVTNIMEPENRKTISLNSSWPHAFARIMARERRAAHGPNSRDCWSPGNQHAYNPHFPRTSGHWAARSLD